MTGQNRSDSYPKLRCEVRGCSSHGIASRVVGALADHAGLPDAGAAQAVLLCYEHFAELAITRDPEGYSGE